MRFLIDPVARTVTEVGEDFEFSPIAGQLNEEGVMIQVTGDPNSHFLLDGIFPTPFVGRAVVSGDHLTLDRIVEAIDFGTVLSTGTATMFMGERNIREIQ
jgi:hypothetical protein